MKGIDLKTDLGAKERSISDIIRFVKTKNSNIPNYSLFLGAGSSVTSNIKSATDLINEWQKDLFLADPENKGKECTKEEIKNYFNLSKHSIWYDKNNLYSSLFEKKYDLPRQRRIFVEEQVAEKTPSIGYAYLIRLVQNQYFNTIFTTNFDDLVNEAFHLFSETLSQKGNCIFKRPIVCAHDSSVKSITVTSSRPKIIKLHGDYLFDDIKSTLRETESLQENIKNKLIEFCKEFGLIVVGYGGNDRSVMDVINYLLKSEDYFKHGIYWCLRKDDEISDEVKKLLWKEKVYFIYIEGFDEFFAELYHEITGLEAPPVPRLFSSRNQIIQSFIDNEAIAQSNSFRLKNAIRMLEEEKKRNSLFELLKNNMSEKEKIDNELDNEEFEQLLEVQALLVQKEFTKAKEKINAYLSAANISKILKNKLKQYLIDAFMETEDHITALRKCEELIEDNPKNVQYYLKKANIINNLEDKIKPLEQALQVDKYNYRIYEKYSHILEKIIDSNCSINTRSQNINKLFEICNQGIERNPSISNSCWKIKFTALKEYKKEASEHWNKDCQDIISKLSIQDNNHYYVFKFKADLLEYEDKDKAEELFQEVMKVLSEKEKEDQSYCISLLFHLVHKFSLSKHYLEVENYFNNDPFFQDDEDLMMNYALFLACKKGQIIDAINAIEKALSKETHKEWISSLMEYNSFLGKQEEIPKIFEKYKDRLGLRSRLSLEAYCNQLQGNYKEEKNIIDRLYSLSYYKDEFIHKRLYNLLKLENYDEVINIGKAFLEEKYFNRNYTAEIINYELAKSKMDKKVSPKRLNEIKDFSESKIVKAACDSLMDNYESSIKYLTDALERDYTNYFSIIEFPVFDNLRNQEAYIALMGKYQKKLSL